MPEKKNKQEISANTIAIWAEKGIKVDELNEEEKDYLAHGGLDEVYTIRDNIRQPMPALEHEAIDKLMKNIFPEPEAEQEASLNQLWVIFREKTLEIFEEFSGWNFGSPAFAYRGDEKKQISYYKEIGKITVHLEILKKEDRLADLSICLTDDSSREKSSFELELFRGKRCLETIKTETGNIATLSSIEVGDYQLRLSDTKGEITSLAIRMEQ